MSCLYKKKIDGLAGINGLVEIKEKQKMWVFVIYKKSFFYEMQTFGRSSVLIIGT